MTFQMAQAILPAASPLLGTLGGFAPFRRVPHI